MLIFRRKACHICQKCTHRRQELGVERRGSNTNILRIKEVIHHIGDVRLFKVAKLYGNALCQKAIHQRMSHLVG